MALPYPLRCLPIVVLSVSLSILLTSPSIDGVDGEGGLFSKCRLSKTERMLMSSLTEGTALDEGTSKGIDLRPVTQPVRTTELTKTVAIKNIFFMKHPFLLLTHYASVRRFLRDTST